MGTKSKNSSSLWFKKNEPWFMNFNGPISLLIGVGDTVDVERETLGAFNRVGLYGWILIRWKFA